VGLLAPLVLAPLAASILIAMPVPAAPAACRAATLLRRGDAASIERHVRGTDRRVLTFVGYSGAGYEDPAAMKREAGRLLDRHDPRRTLVSSGATAEGIGAVYELARERGFPTLGIVSDLARQEKVPLSPCVEVAFFVPDATWGGELPNGAGLSPTSAAVVAASDELVGIGGGAIARDELLAARRAGKPVTFIPADMNHAKAREKARRQGEPEPTNFTGEAAAHQLRDQLPSGAAVQ
jgi:hypothetical protein